MIYRLMIHQFS